MKKPKIKYILFISFFWAQGLGQTVDLSTETEKLLSRLVLDLEPMAQVQRTRKNPAQAATNLLHYYRARNWVNHPVEGLSNKQGKDIIVSERDQKWANDALQHVFVGQPAYPSQFCGDDINWNTRPVPDMEWVWQLNRMYFWTAMGNMYQQTGDEKYAQAWCDQIVDWVRKNPRDQQHKYAWRSIEAGIRGYSWARLFHQFLASPHFTPEVLVTFLNSCYDHAAFLMTKYSSGSNWGLMEAEGLAFIAGIFPEFKESEIWWKEATRRLNQEISIQVYPDGHQRELAMGYHLGCIRWFLRTYELAKLNQMEQAFSTSYLETIEKMCEVPMKICLPDGTNAQFGDAWRGAPGQHVDKFLEWAQLFDREDFLYMATNGEKGIAPGQTAFALPESGLYSMRSGWNVDATCMVLKCGPDGGGHCQPDNGTFVLYAGGRNLMPDAGSYIYSGDPENRNWFRQTNIHQTLTLDGKNTRYGPNLLKWKPGKDLDVLVVENAGYENLTHRRAVFFVDKRYFIIVDDAIGNGTGNVDIHFQLAPGEAIFDQENLSVHSNFSEGWNIMVSTEKQENITLEEEEGQVSFVYTKKEPRPAFRFRKVKTSKNTAVRFITLVVPYQKEKPKMSIQWQDKLNVGSSNIRLIVEENGKRKTIEYEH